jgi:hypothetical protein
MQSVCICYAHSSNKHKKRKIAFDPDIPKHKASRFKQYDWTDMYRDAKEAIPTNAPTPRGKAVVTSCFVDANLAGDTATRRSQTGILIFVNKALFLRQQQLQL